MLPRLLVLVLLTLCGMLIPPSALADPDEGSAATSVDPSSPEGVSILAVATADLVGQLGKPARLHAIDIKEADGWAFVDSSIQAPDGRPFDYAGTPFAEAAAHHMKSNKYVALLHQDEQPWELIASRVGPTDVFWANWSQEYGAPQAVFGPKVH